VLDDEVVADRDAGPVDRADRQLERHLRSAAGRHPPRPDAVDELQHAPLVVRVDDIDREAHEPHVDGSRGLDPQALLGVEARPAEQSLRPRPRRDRERAVLTDDRATFQADAGQLPCSLVEDSTTDYHSGDDFTVEFLDYRYRFARTDFAQRVAAAAVRLELVPDRDLEPGEMDDLVALAADGLVEKPGSPLGAYLETARGWQRMNTKLVSSIDAVARSRLMTISADALLVDAAKALSDTQISLIVVCDSDEAMVGVITKTNIVQQIGHCGERACATTATDVMTRDVVYCRPTDCLPDVLSMMQNRGFVHVPIVDENCKPSGACASWCAWEGSPGTGCSALWATWASARRASRGSATGPRPRSGRTTSSARITPASRTPSPAG